jgi:diguanylate cyclase (GGDEF)-like protein
MLPDHAPKVLILTGEAAASRRLRDALAELTASVWLSQSDLPPGEGVDVIVTDLPAHEVARSANLKLDPAPAESDLARAGVAIVAVGSAPWADVELAADWTSRELCLACRLAAEIARLRRQRDELDRIREEVTQLAQTDPLTGLANRRAWEDQLQARLARDSHRRQWLAIVDLDDFKQVNDRLGMSKGDEVLAGAARSLAGQLRREDIVARLGGDEFGILLWNVAPEHVPAVFDRLRGAVAAESATDASAKITASIGYVLAVDGSTGAAELFAAAERAMREAKRAGGNRALRGKLSRSTGG